MSNLSEQGFNSTLVRLKALRYLAVTDPGDWFQFHAGSIKGNDARTVPSFAVIGSIPRWFD